METPPRSNIGSATSKSEPLKPVLSSKSDNSAVRWLHSGVAALLLVLTFIGFQQFYLHGMAYPTHPIAPPIKGLVVAHGVTMTCWLVLSLIQPLLIATGNRRIHMKLGVLGAVLAASIVVIGYMTPIAAARVEPDVTIWGLNRIHFMAIPIIAITTFGGFVITGILNRRRPETHRAMMLLATLAALAAATDRITGLPDLYAATPVGALFGPFLPALLIGAGFFFLKWALTRTLDRSFATGYTILVIVCAFIMKLAPTHAWEQFATSLVSK